MSDTATVGMRLLVERVGISGEDVVDVLTEDHREFEGMLEQLRSGAQPQVTRVLTAALLRHAIAEEEYVYPAVRDHVTGGERLADRGMSQHAQLEETMQQLETSATGSAEHQRLVSALAIEVRRHISHDIGELFPRLRAACTRSHLTWLGERVAGLRHAGREMVRIGAIRKVEPATLIEQVRKALAGRTRDNAG